MIDSAIARLGRWNKPVTRAVSEAPTNATVAYRELPPKIAGMRLTIMSRITPPPTAVVTPSAIAGSQCRPKFRDLMVPVAAHAPIPMKSMMSMVRVAQRALKSMLYARMEDTIAPTQ